MTHRLSAWLVLVGALLGSTTALAIPVARFQFQSDPGDWVGDGQTVDKVYDTSNGDLVVTSAEIDSSGNLYQANIFLDSDTFPTAMMRVGTWKLGTPLVPGEYLNAQNLPFEDPGHPGLDVTYQGRGENTITGQFTLFEVTYSAHLGRILSLVFEFEQHGDGREPAIRGRLDYNAAGLPIPEPSTALLTLFGLVGLGWRRRGGLASGHPSPGRSHRN